MQQADLEREIQQANEELEVLLRELVIEPTDTRMKENIQNALFDFEERIEEKLKKQISAIGKIRELDQKFDDVVDSIDGLGEKTRKQLDGLASALAANLGQIQSGILERQSQLSDVLGQLGDACQLYSQQHQQSFKQVSDQLTQKADQIREHLSSKELLAHERNSQLKTTLEDMLHLLSKGNQLVSSLPLSFRENTAQILAQSTRNTAGMQRLEDLVSQQQSLMSDYQSHLQSLRRSLRRIYWSGMVFGVIIVGAIVFVAFGGQALTAL